MGQNPKSLEQVLLANPQQISDDSDVRKSIDLLPDNFRPTVPVRLFDDPDKLYDTVLKNLHGPKLSAGAIGVVPIDKSAIYIDRKANDFADPYTRAAILAHEQYHVTQPHNDRRESPAYAQQLDFINQNPIRFKTNYRKEIERIYAMFQKREQANK